MPTINIARTLLASACTFLVLSLTISCNKTPTIPSSATYSFTNTTSAAIALDLYDSQDDYYHNSNKRAQYQMQPGETISLSLTALKAYWIDWYSASYSYTNWVDTQRMPYYVTITPLPHIVVALGDDHFDIKTTVNDTLRSVILNGNEISSRWKAVVSEATPRAGTYFFTLRKDFTCTYVFTSAASGSSDTINTSYHTSNGYPGFSVIINDAVAPALGFLAFNTYSSTSQPANRDSLVFTFYGHTDPYWAVRQH